MTYKEAKEIIKWAEGYGRLIENCEGSREVDPISSMSNAKAYGEALAFIYAVDKMKPLVGALERVREEIYGCKVFDNCCTCNVRKALADYKRDVLGEKE